MSSFEKALTVLVNDLSMIASGWGDRILSNKVGMSHQDYLVCNARYHALAETVAFIKTARERANQDEDFPDTLMSKEEPTEQQEEPQSVGATVDIATGDVTQSVGGNA